MTEQEEIVAAYKLESHEVILLLKRQLADVKREQRTWMRRCQELEMELLRSGWTESRLSWLYCDTDQQVS